MRITRSKASGAVRWLGLGRGRRTLEGEVAIVSPHLDDAVLSLGAAISRAGRHGVQPVVLTVLAGDPRSDVPAGEWDAQAGFGTAGEAARERQREDAEACRLLGARPIWLPFSDHQYPRGGSEETVRAAVVEAVGSASVLLPGFPLMNDDHRWLRRVLDGAFEPGRTAVYVEQPYAALWTAAPGDGPSPEPDRVPPPVRWEPLGARISDQRRKLAACRAYRSQLPLLGRVLGAVFRYELRAGGESAAWTS